MDIDCRNCDGNGVIVVEELENGLMVELCLTCDGEGSEPWFKSSSARIPIPVESR